MPSSIHARQHHLSLHNHMKWFYYSSRFADEGTEAWREWVTCLVSFHLSKWRSWDSHSGLGPWRLYSSSWQVVKMYLLYGSKSQTLYSNSTYLPAVNLPLNRLLLGFSDEVIEMLREWNGLTQTRCLMQHLTRQRQSQNSSFCYYRGRGYCRWYPESCEEWGAPAALSWDSRTQLADEGLPPSALYFGSSLGMDEDKKTSQGKLKERLVCVCVCALEWWVGGA